MERIPLHYLFLSRLWKERILLYIGWMDIDYAIRKEELPLITSASTPATVVLYTRYMSDGSDPIDSA